MISAPKKPTIPSFRIPSQVTQGERVSFCLSIIDKYRDELVPIRKVVSNLTRQAVIWREKYHKANGELEKTKRENDRLKKEIGELEQEIEKLTKTTNRYQAALFNHGNFQSPLEKEEEKKKGGQAGHADTNREVRENSSQYSRKRIFLTACGHCGKHLNRVGVAKRKTLLDIVLNQEAIKLVIESERQWCGHCQKEVAAQDERSLPFTEYGINTFMMVLLLRFRCLLPLARIVSVLSIGYGLKISTGSIVSLISSARRYLGPKYEELKKTVRTGEVMYNDETGWQVRGETAWMWIMANEEATIYVAAESRGGGVAKEIYGNSQAYSMHDGLASYTKALPKNKHLYCWAHVLRFCYEETVNKPHSCESVRIRDALVKIYHLKKNQKYQGHPLRLEREAWRQMKHLLNYKSKDPTTLVLLHRLREQHEGLISSLVVSPNGTNNFAEQELRPIALMRKISYGSDTFTGMETTAVLTSVIQTLYRTKRETFFPSLAASLRAGFVNS